MGSLGRAPAEIRSPRCPARYEQRGSGGVEVQPRVEALRTPTATMMLVELVVTVGHRRATGDHHVAVCLNRAASAARRSSRYPFLFVVFGTTARNRVEQCVLPVQVAPGSHGVLIRISLSSRTLAS